MKKKTGPVARSKDWKDWGDRGFPYKGLKDPDYIKDRDALFRKNGNGWWWFVGCVKPVDNYCKPVDNPDPPLKNIKGWVLKYLNT